MNRATLNRALRSLGTALAATAMIAATLAVPAGPAGADAPQRAMVGGGCLDHGTLAVDDYAWAIPLGFTAKLWGQSYEIGYLSTNGTISFDTSFYGYEPHRFGTSSIPIIAPFFYDGDNRTSKRFTFGYTTWEGRPALCMNYNEVPALGSPSLSATFQVLLVDRSDIEPGDFDMVFNYDALSDRIYAAAGYARAGERETLIMEGSKIMHPNPETLTDGGANALTSHRYGSDVAGRYIFPVRGGYPLAPDLIVRNTNLPEPALTLQGTQRSVAVDTTFTPQFATDSTAVPRFVVRGFKPVCSVSDGVVSASSAGQCTVTVELPADGTWGPVTRTATYTIAPHQQTLDFTAPPTAKVGIPVPLTATSSAGLPITYSSLTPDRCTVDGATAIPVAPGACQIEADQPGNAEYAAATTVRTFEIEGIATAATITSAPTTAAAGGTVTVDVELTAADALPLEYVQGATVTVAGDALTTTVEAPHVDGASGSARVRATLDEHVAPGARTVTVTFPAHGDFDAAAASFPLEVTTAPAALAVSAPPTLTYGDAHSLTVELDTDPALPVDGTFAVTADVSDPPSEIASVSATAGPVAITLPDLPVGTHTLTVEHRGATFHSASSATHTVEITPIEVDVELHADRLVAGLPTTFTATPSRAFLPGTIELFVDGIKVVEGDPWGGTVTGTVTLAPGDVEVTARFVPLAGHPEYAPAERTTTYAVERSGTTVDITTRYTAPTAPNSTGLFESMVCVEPDNAGLDVHLAGSKVDITIVNAVTGDVHETSGPVAAGSCVILMVAQLAAGEHTLTATYGGNDYLASSSGTATFTVLHAPTTISLDVVGDLGDTYGAPTTLEATLSQPVSGHDRTGDVTFYANGVELGSVTPIGRTATLTVHLPAGDDIEVTAAYSGDDVHAPATSVPQLFDVAQGTAEVSLSVTPERVTAGEESTLTAIVTAENPTLAASGFSGGAFSLLGGSAPAAPGDGTVTFHVNGVAVGTRPLVGGVASMKYVLPVGTNTISVSYSGSPNLAAVAANAVAPVDVEVAAAEAPSPPTPVAPMPAPQPVDPASAAPGDRARPAGTAPRRRPSNLAHTGADVDTLVSLGGVLLTVGLVIGRFRRRETD